VLNRSSERNIGRDGRVEMKMNALVFKLQVAPGILSLAVPASCCMAVRLVLRVLLVPPI